MHYLHVSCQKMINKQFSFTYLNFTFFQKSWEDDTQVPYLFLNRVSPPSRLPSTWDCSDEESEGEDSIPVSTKKVIIILLL